MQRLTSLSDILKACTQEVIQDFPTLHSFFLYGSFCSQEPSSETSSYEKLHGKNGLLDKKPDFIAVVADLEKSLLDFCSKRNWNEQKMRRILQLDRETPYYFNVETRSKFEFPLTKETEAERISYKIGIVPEDVFMNLPKADGHNIFLESRLSKPINIVYSVDNPLMEKKLDSVRKYFVDLTLTTLPGRFTGETFVRRYLQLSFLAEAFRVFDIVKTKHLKILNSRFYDMAIGKTVPMREELEGMLAPKLVSHDKITIGSQDGFYRSIYINETESTRLQNLYDFISFNLFSLKNAFYKTWITNGASSSTIIGWVNNLRYGLRKFR